MTWWQVKLLKWGIRWYGLKSFKFPPKIKRITVFSRGNITDVLVFYQVKKAFYYKQISVFGKVKILGLAKQFFKAIKQKEIFFRDKF